MPDLILTPDELQALTGRRRTAAQLEVLRQRGFWRAHINAGGRLVLERAHYEAVCRGGDVERKRPVITPPRALLRAA